MVVARGSVLCMYISAHQRAQAHHYLVTYILYMEDMYTPSQPSQPLASTVQNGMMQPPLHHSSKPLRIFLVILVVILVGWGLFVLLNQKAVTYDDQGNPITTADAGTLVSGFPEALLAFEPNAAISESFRIDYLNKNQSLPFARYTSAKTYQENIDGFKTLLQEQAWAVTKQGSILETPVTNFYAVKEKEQLNITLTQNEDSTVTVQIAYSLTN